MHYSADDHIISFEDGWSINTTYAKQSFDLMTDQMSFNPDTHKKIGGSPKNLFILNANFKKDSDRKDITYFDTDINNELREFVIQDCNFDECWADTFCRMFLM